MVEVIQHIDESILHGIHVSGGNAWLDQVIPFFRNPYFWSPIYLFLLVFMWKNYGKQGMVWCLFFLMTFVFCDFISASIIKPMFHRLRPCNNEMLSFSVRQLIACGSGFSFPSSHATNHFGFACFMITTLQHRFRIVRPLVLLWALLVCYAQLYVCVHYPSDILGGALLGIVIGWLFGRYFTKRFGNLGNKPVFIDASE